MNIVPIRITRAMYEQIEREGATAYPNECCGIIYGRDTASERIIENLEPVRNEFESGEQYHRFLITPDVMLRAEMTSSANGNVVLGFYHSHPDHPARPSEYDREHGWPFYSYIIVSIAKREPVDMTSWVLDEKTETFARQDILETEQQEERQI